MKWRANLSRSFDLPKSAFANIILNLKTSLTPICVNYPDSALPLYAAPFSLMIFLGGGLAEVYDDDFDKEVDLIDHLPGRAKGKY